MSPGIVGPGVTATGSAGPPQAPTGPVGPTGPSTSVSPPIAGLAPPGVQGPQGPPTPGTAPTPDVFRSWRLFTRSIGVHLPNAINRARATGAQVRRIGS